MVLPKLRGLKPTKKDVPATIRKAGLIPTGDLRNMLFGAKVWQAEDGNVVISFNDPINAHHHSDWGYKYVTVGNIKYHVDGVLVAEEG